MKIIRPVNVTDSMVNENTAYPASVNEWESLGYAFIQDSRPVNQMEFSGSEDKLWVLVGGMGSTESETKIYLAGAPGSSVLSMPTSFNKLEGISSEPMGSRVVRTSGGFRLIIYDNSLSVVHGATNFTGGTLVESKIIWSGSHIYWMQRYIDGTGFWSLSKWDETLTMVWEEIYDGSAEDIQRLELFDVKGSNIVLGKTEALSHSVLLVDTDTRVWDDIPLSAPLYAHKAVMLPDLSAIYFTQRDTDIGLYKMSGAGYATIARVIEPSGVPTEPGDLRASSDSAWVSLSSGFSSHIVATASDTFVGGTERSLFKTYEEAPAIPFDRNNAYIAVHPKQPDDLGIYNLWETTGWTQIVGDASDYVTGDTVYQDKKLYEALVDNPTQSPENGINTDPPQWVFVGYINPWKMFDGGTSTPSLGADIDVSLTPGAPVTGVALLGMGASTVQVTMTDPTDGLVYDTGVVSLLDNNIVDNWFQYFFAPYQYVQDFTVVDLPFYKSATIDVAVTNTEGDSAIGELVIGSVLEIGEANFGTSVGIIDYSRKEVDEFGNFQITKRRFSKRAEYDITIRSKATGSVQTELAKYRTTPIVWVGDENRPSTIVYGYYRDFDIILSNLAVSDCSITVEGL